MMNQKRRQKIRLVLLFLVMILLIACGVWGQNNVNQNAVVRLGNPLADDGHQGRALNVWDLQTFDGKIYLGGGSTVSNAGPINVWAYDPSNQEFVKEYAVEEEAIEHYKVFGDRLYIPAADPTQGNKNKFYRREADQWRKYATEVVKLAHVRDLITTNNHQDILMVGNNPSPDQLSSRGTTIATTTKDGLVFSSAGVDNFSSTDIMVDYNWFFSVFRYQDRILATNSLLRDGDNYLGSTAEYDFQSKEFLFDDNFRNDEFIPQSLIGKNGKYGFEVIYRPWNPVEFQGYLVYPVRSYSISRNNYRQAYMNSIGFFYKSGMGNTPQEIKLPKKALGEDVLVIGHELYVLANKKKRDGNTVYVYKTDSLEPRIKWQQVLKFDSSNKARSFEYLNGTFYFGLGQNYGEAIANSGDLLSYTLK